MNSIQKVINKPLIFLRFNPDKYTNNGKTVLSSFKLNKDTNKLEIRNYKEWSKRLNELKKTIDYWLINNVDKELTVIYLFYNIL